MSKWKFVALSEVCNIEKGKTGLMKAEPGEYPLVATGQERRTCNTYQFDTKAVCIPLVSSTGHGHASLKYVHYQEGKFALGTILAAVIPKDENVLNAQFLHLYLSRLKDELLVPLMTGAANVTLTVTKLKTVKVPLPPIEEQLRIVSLFNRMDNEQKELVEEIETQQTLLKKLRQSILQEAIKGKLTAKWRAEHPDVEPASILLEKIRAEKERLVKEKKIKKQKPLPPIGDEEKPFEIPETWEWCRLGDILQLTTAGKSPKCENRQVNDSEWGVIKTTAIQDMKFVENENKVLPNGFEILDKYIIHENDLIITRAGPINRVGIVCEVKKLSKKLILSDKTIRMKHNKNFVLPGFMQYVMNCKSIKLNMQKFMTGMADSQVNISQDNIKKFLVLISPIEEQKEIVKKIESLFKICDALEEQIKQAKADSEMLMQAILWEAFEG